MFYFPLIAILLLLTIIITTTTRLKTPIIMNNNASTSNKKTKGRRKMPLKLIENMNNRMVTYSKRKNGLFKKFSELCTLCGAEGVVLVTSPAGKPYAFGHPSVEVIRNRFLYGGNQPHQANPPTLSIIRLNFKLESVKNDLEGEGERGDGLMAARTAMRPEETRMLAEVDNLGSEELRQLEALLIMMKNNLSNHGSWLERAHSGLSLNPALVAENPAAQSVYYQSTMLGRQIYNNNPIIINNNNNPIHFNAPIHQYNNPPMMMIPAPQGFIYNPTLGNRATHAGNFASSTVMHNFMDAGFPNLNMGHPCQGNSTQVPIQGQFDGNPNQNTAPPFQGTMNQVPFQGQFDGNQNFPANTETPPNLPSNP